MATKRKVEVFSAGCAMCNEVIEVVKRAACPSCEVIVHNMNDPDVAKRAKSLGVRSVPSVMRRAVATCAGSPSKKRCCLRPRLKR
jgi:hypothetical protein